MKIELTDILNIIYALAVVILGRYIIPYIKAKLEQAGQADLIQLIEQLVQAAEQVFGAGNGSEKKGYVVERLTAQGIPLTEKTDAMIEAAVLRLGDMEKKEGAEAA